MAGDTIISFIGQLLLIFAFLVSIHNAINPKLNLYSRVKDISFLLQISPFTLLVFAFLIDADSLTLVAEYGGADLPLFYRISAVWGGRAGPLLLWASLMGMVTWIMAQLDNNNDLALKIMHSWVAYLLLISWILDPFSPYKGIDGELNPLLQTNLMVIHPPIVFLYYSLCIATATVALSGIIQKLPSKIIHNSLLPWARSAFFIGTLGIGLGGLWAYTVLDWGGYWAWDPVETGSLLPWLSLLLIIHARSKPNSTSAYRVSPSLGVITGVLAFHATLVTRANGVWASVHAFVGNEETVLSKDPYLRIIDISDSSPVGLEVLSYLLAIILLGSFSILHLYREQTNALLKNNEKSFFELNKYLSISLLIFFFLISLSIGSSAILVMGLCILFLMLNESSEKPAFHWMIAGIILMLYSNWSWSANIYQAFLGMIPFLVPWFLSDLDDDMSILIRPFTSTSQRIKLAKNIPWYGGLTFLLLTWILLTVEIEGSNILAHEFYGAPIIGLMAMGLTLYAWGNSINSRNGNILLFLCLFISILLAYLSNDIYLPGDPNLSVTPGISRGALGLFILTWLLFSLPPTIHQLFDTSKNTLSRLRKKGFNDTKSTVILRKLGSNIAHLGIILLLIGHVFTTTLVDRTDPSHLVTLVKDQPIEHRGYDYIFTGVEKINSTDADYPFSIGDGYIGITIEVLQEGEKLTEISPGMLRFTTGNSVSPRSEVDRFSTLFGDTIVILDFYQSQELLEWMTFGQSEEVDRVRVTVHSLPGSHLVWLGWTIIMLGSLFSLSSGVNRATKEEE